METTKQLLKTTYKYVAVLYLFSMAVSVFWVEDYVPFIIGLTFGVVISVVNFFELARTVHQSVMLHPKKAHSYAIRHYFIRFLINAVVIFISIKAPYINIFGTIIGLLLIKFVIYFANLFNDKEYFKNIIRRKEGE
ncbi:MAG: ATP synthase subunit I [Clostridia bacterium]|nr:ATP synthase subunit I [Clostridia bacterium]